MRVDSSVKYYPYSMAQSVLSASQTSLLLASTRRLASSHFQELSCLLLEQFMFRNTFSKAPIERNKPKKHQLNRHLPSLCCNYLVVSSLASAPMLLCTYAVLAAQPMAEH